MSQKNPSSWILKNSKELSLRWTPRWKIFRPQPRFLLMKSFHAQALTAILSTRPWMLLNALLMAFQVAAQQGVYLADCFNRMEEAENNPEGPLRFRGEGRHKFRPFRYESNFHDIFSPSLELEAGSHRCWRSFNWMTPLYGRSVAMTEEGGYPVQESHSILFWSITH